MKRVSLDIVEEGSILARSLENEGGITMAGQGTRMTSRLIARFKVEKITEIWIEGDNPLSNEKYLKIQEKIENRFAAFPEDTLMNKLKSVLIEDLENRLEDH